MEGYLGQKALGAMILVGTTVRIIFTLIYLKPDNPLAYAGWAIGFVQLVHLVILIQRMKSDDEVTKSKLNEGWETK